MTTVPTSGRVAAALAAALAVGGSAWFLAVPPEPGPATRTGAFVAVPAAATATVAPPVAASAPPDAEPAPPLVSARSADLSALEVGDAGQPPVRVRVPDAGIDLPVRPAGVDERGAMEVPPGSFEAAWYRHGPGAGADEGAAVVAAHVSSRVDGRGPFARLVALAPGARIELVTEDGTRAYEVVAVEQVAKLALDTAGLFDRSGDHRLHLVTCGGRFDRAAGSYEDNVVVVARPAG